MSRMVSRKHAFIIIYQMPFHSPGGMDAEELKELAEDYLSGVKGLAPDDRGFIVNAVEGVAGSLGSIDALIANSAEGWTLDRLSKIDLAVMRLAIFEMLYAEDIPVSVSINEAVELCKTYGDDGSPAYVNGVLGTVARESGNEGASL